MKESFKNYILKPTYTGFFEGVTFEGKPGKLVFEEYPSLTAEDLKGKYVYLILKPKTFYFEIYRVNMPVFNKQAMTLRLRDRIDTQGFLTGPYKLFWQVLEKADSTYTVFLLAIPVNEFDPIVIPLKEVAKARIKFITFLPFLLARLSSTEPQIIVHKEKEGLWLTLAEKAIPYYVEFIPIDEMVGVDYATLSSRINFFQRLYRGDTGKEANIVSVTSPELKEGLEGVGSQNISLAENFNLYLTIFEVSQKFNLLSEEELSVLRFMEINKKLAYGMYGLSIIFLFLFCAFWYWNRNIEREISHKEGLTIQSINQLLSQYPSEKIKEFQNYVLQKKEVQTYPSISEILYNLANLDTDYTINELTVGRVGKDYQISVQLQKKIEPEGITNFYQNILNKMSSFIIINNSTNHYNVENNTFTLNIQGIIKPKK
jgi:hypothetical protein